MKKISLVLTVLALSAVIFCGCGPIEDERYTDSRVIVTTVTEDSITTVEEDSIIDSSIVESADESSDIDESSEGGSSEEEESSSAVELKTAQTAVTLPEVIIPEETVTEREIYTAPVQEEIVYEPEVTEEETTSQIEEEYIVYKPSTHYVHRSTCRWVTDECYEISNTNDIEARKCSECNPDIEIVNEYKKPVKETTPVEDTPTYGIDSYSRQLLAEIVWHEAGSNWISQYNKAKIAAGVMNRVNDSRFPSTVYGVLTQVGQFTGFWPGYCTPTQACYDAVDYYFAHTNEFNSDNSWWGDGYQNHFYYQ